MGVCLFISFVKQNHPKGARAQYSDASPKTVLQLRVPKREVPQNEAHGP